MIIDERFKDANPEKTVERIQAILQNNDIHVTEDWFDSGVLDCYSVRVTVDGTSFGSNGKGITKKLARASAYAELMERMQAGYLSRRFYRDNPLEYNDAVRVDKEEFINKCSKWLKAVSNGVSNLLHMDCTESIVADKCIEAENASDDKITLLPFFDAVDQTMTLYPQKIIPSLYTTNGLAAGNTFEEACVQGYSELFERRNLLKCFFGTITPPDIPDSYLQRYAKSYQIIQNIKENGLELQIKDCSLGEDFPLVAAVAIDKSTHSYHVHMGAHPVFEIALERCLTEMFQGRTINNVTEIHELSIGGKKGRTTAELYQLLTKGSGKYPTSFFCGEPSYAFKPFTDRSTRTNKELLAEIVRGLKEQDYHLLVRSTAHLGFSSVRLIIPGFSEAFPIRMMSKFPTAKLLDKYQLAPYTINSMKSDELEEYRLFLNNQVQNYGNTAIDITVLTGRNFTGNSKRKNTFLAQMIFAKLEWKRDKLKAITIAKSALPLSTGYSNNYLSCVCMTFEYLLNGLTVQDAERDLSVFFEESVIRDVVDGYTVADTPFDKLMLKCQSNDCSACEYLETCNKKGTEALINKIKDAAKRYDNAAAFATLSALYGNLDRQTT